MYEIEIKIKIFGVQGYWYAVDTQLYVSFPSNLHQAMESLKRNSGRRKGAGCALACLLAKHLCGKAF